MPDQQATKGAKKGRKFGRSERGASMKAYNNTNRCAINKARKQAKHAAAVAYEAANPPEVPRGTRRHSKRGILCVAYVP